MDELIEDVTKVQKIIADVVSQQTNVSLDRIFYMLEQFPEPSSMRVEKVASSLIAELEPPQDEEAFTKMSRFEKAVEPSLRNSTSNAVVDIDPKVEETVAKMLDNEDEESGESVVEICLRNDANRVRRILAESNGKERDYAEIYAYLEAHIEKRNRVPIVVEELLGMTETYEEEPIITRIF